MLYCLTASRTFSFILLSWDDLLILKCGSLPVVFFLCFWEQGPVKRYWLDLNPECRDLGHPHYAWPQRMCLIQLFQCSQEAVAVCWLPFWCWELTLGLLRASQVLYLALGYIPARGFLRQFNCCSGGSWAFMKDGLEFMIIYLPLLNALACSTTWVW